MLAAKLGDLRTFARGPGATARTIARFQHHDLVAYVGKLIRRGKTC